MGCRQTGKINLPSAGNTRNRQQNTSHRKVGNQYSHSYTSMGWMGDSSKCLKPSHFHMSWCILGCWGKRVSGPMFIKILNFFVKIFSYLNFLVLAKDDSMFEFINTCSFILIVRTGIKEFAKSTSLGIFLCKILYEYGP